MIGLLCLVFGGVGLFLAVSKSGQPPAPIVAVDPSTANPHAMVRLSVVVPVGLAPADVLHVGADVTLCDADGDMIAGIVASEPSTLPESSRYRFDVWVGLDDATSLAQWIATSNVVVASP